MKYEVSSSKTLDFIPYYLFTTPRGPFGAPQGPQMDPDFSDPPPKCLVRPLGNYIPNLTYFSKNEAYPLIVTLTDYTKEES